MKTNYKEKYMYLLAEFDNYKKRVVKDQELLKQNTFINTILPFLEINDFLEMARISCEKSTNIDAIKYGVNMIVDKFSGILENNNVTRINTKHAQFDPVYHEATEYVESDTIEKDYIISEIKAGYTVNNVVICPAIVTVSSGKKVNKK